jgi:cell division protein FtsN
MLGENKLTGAVNPGNDYKEAQQPVRNEITLYTSSDETRLNDGDSQPVISEDSAPENIGLPHQETSNPLELPSIPSGFQNAAKDQSILDVPPPTPSFEPMTVGVTTKSGNGLETEHGQNILRESLDKSSGRAEFMPGFTGSEEKFLRIDSSTNGSGASDGPATNSIRMVRVSLLWLLLSGSVFLTFIIALNTMTGSVDQSGEVPREVRSTNSSTNQAPDNPVKAAPAPVEESRVEPAPAPTAQPMKESRVEPTPAPTVEAKPESQPQREKVAETEVRPPAPVPASTNASGKFTVQIGSYNESGQARERLASLNSLGIEARIAQVEIPKRGTWYRVQAGRFSTREEANRYAGELRSRRVAESTIITEISD